MSLNYDYTKCPKPENDNDYACVDSLIWATIPVGISHITEQNYQEFYARVHTLELLGDSFRVGVDQKNKQVRVYFTLAEVKRWIGLKTNASTKTRTQFYKYIGIMMTEFIKKGDS